MDIFSYFSAGMEAPWFTSYLFICTCLGYTPNLILACLTVYQWGLGWGGVELGAWKCMDYTEFIVLWAYIKVFHDLKHYFVISGWTWIIGVFVPLWAKMVIGWWWWVVVMLECVYILHISWFYEHISRFYRNLKQYWVISGCALILEFLSRCGRKWSVIQNVP